MMKRFKNILAAIDFSDYSEAVAQTAADLANGLDTRLFFVNVLNRRDVEMLDKVKEIHPEFQRKQYLDENIADRKTNLRNLAEKVRGDLVDVESLVVIGVPFEELLREIEVRKPDILVIGTKGRSNIIDTLMGSCALKLIRRSPVPVLGVPIAKPR